MSWSFVKTLDTNLAACSRNIVSLQEMFSTISGELGYDLRVLYRETRRIPRTLHIKKGKL